jgi:hypothetical protein
MKYLIFIVLNSFSLSLFAQINYTRYSKSEVEEDLNFAFEKLTNIHPFFLDNEEFELHRNIFLQTKESLKDSMTQNEVYLLLAPLLSSLNDGHTCVNMPLNQRAEYSAAGGKAFPFFVNIVNDSIYVSFYCGNDSSLFYGGEQILEINGIEASKMVHDMEILYGGKSSANKQKAIADKFRFLIWIFYQFEGNYELTIKNNQHEIRELTIPGITSTEFRQNIKRMPKANNTNFAFRLNQHEETALIKIKSFGDLNGFCAFADSAFAEINKNKIKNLVIDVRNNGGGRSVVVDSLMNYLTDKAYAQYQRIETRVSPELIERYKKRYPERVEWITQYAVNELVSQDSNVKSPANNNLLFKGNLFLLVNKTSFSAAATFAGVFKELKLGTIIGEETGGTIGYYGDYWNMKTIHTGINFYVSPKRFIQHGGNDLDKGVLPDYLVEDNGELILNFTSELIKKQRSVN